MDEEEKPTFSPRVRTTVYVTGLFVAFGTFVGAAIALSVDEAELAGILGLVGTGWAGIASGFGVAYRPTR